MKYVLLTGACGGMGRAVAEMLSEEGFFVFALDRRLPEIIKENVMPIEADVTDTESLSAAMEKIKSITDELYAVVHFAGIYSLDSLIEIDEEEFIRAFDINLFGVYRINKAAFPYLRENSRIIITTSELAPLDPLPFTGIYALTKSALDKYAYSLRMELQLKKIKVSVLRPGAVKTDMLGVSTSRLEEFCEKTELYKCNATRFRAVVDSVEARNITPNAVARKTLKILKARRPRYVYSINRNPLLLLLNALPHRLQNFIIRQILK